MAGYGEFPGGPSPSPEPNPNPNGAAGPTRYNTTPNWQDPYNPPSPGDPYWAEWIAANPGYQPPTNPDGTVKGQWPTPPPTTPLPTGGPGPTGPTNFDDNPWNPPKPNPLPPPPTFTPPTSTAPTPFTYAPFDMGDPFKAPTIEEAQNSPGYKFRLGQGEDALQNWAAAKGTLNDSSTAKALTDYGQNSASTEYQNVWNRDYNAWGANLGARTNTYAMNRSGALDAYNTNYKTQYEDPWLHSYTGWKDSVLGPGMHEWDANVQNTQHLNDLNNTNAWNSRLFDWNKYTFGQNNYLDRLRILMGLN